MRDRLPLLLSVQTVRIVSLICQSVSVWVYWTWVKNVCQHLVGKIKLVCVTDTSTCGQTIGGKIIELVSNIANFFLTRCCAVYTHQFLANNCLSCEGRLRVKLLNLACACVIRCWFSRQRGSWYLRRRTVWMCPNHMLVPLWRFSNVTEWVATKNGSTTGHPWVQCGVGSLWTGCEQASQGGREGCSQDSEKKRMGPGKEIGDFFVQVLVDFCRACAATSWFSLRI